MTGIVNNKQALASQKNGTLYKGVTSDLVKRMYQHKTQLHSNSFSAKYGVHILVWYVAGEDISSAIALEKKIKNRIETGSGK